MERPRNSYSSGQREEKPDAMSMSTHWDETDTAQEQCTVCLRPLSERAGTAGQKEERQMNWSRTKEWKALKNARVRCTYPAYKSFHRYGGRGIQYKIKDLLELISDIWFAPTLEHTIDRINGDGHYEVGNLRWATRSVQNRACHPPNLYLKGSTNPTASLDESKVRQIRAMLQEGHTQREVAKKFGVHQATIYRIAHGKSWKHV